MSLQVWLPLINDTNNYGVSGFKTASVQSGCSQATDGKLGKCWKNTGTTANVANSVTFNADKFSLCAWVRIDTKRSNWCRAVGLYGASNAMYMGLGCEHSNATTLGFHYYKMIDGTNTKIFDNYPCNVEVGTWVHYVMAYDGTKYYIYKNGVQIVNANVDKANIKAEMVTLYLFGGTPSNYSQCSLNDVRLYDHCVSIKEVKEMAKGLCLHYALDNNGYGMPNYFLNSNFATGTTANWGGVNSSSISITTKDGRKCLTGTKGTSNYLVCQTLSGYSYTANSQINFTISADVYVEATGTITIGNWISTTQASGWQGMSFSETWHTSNSLQVGWNHVSVTHVNTKNQYSGSIITAFAYSAATFWITNLKFEFGDIDTPWCPHTSDASYAIFNINGTRESDLTGYGRHGTLVSAMPTIDSDTPRYSCCYKYAGSTNNVHYNNTTDFNYTDNFSWACWIKTNYTGTTAQFAWTVGRADAGGYGYGIQCTSTTNCNIRFGNKSYGVAVTGEQWTHLAFTKSGTAIKIYKNGAVASNITFDGTLPTYSDGAGVGIGCFHYASGNIYPFYGNLSDFRIYATALSADDILELYRANAEIDTNGRIYSSDFMEV